MQLLYPKPRPLRWVTNGPSWGRLVWLLIAISTPVRAQWNYVVENGQITLTGYTGHEATLEIPGTINGLPVTRIGESAFALNTELNRLTIPDGVVRIETAAFNSCSHLTHVTLGQGLKYIGPYAFNLCARLTGITLPAAVNTVGLGAFFGCTQLGAIDVDAASPFYRSVDGVLFNQDLTTLVHYPPGRAGNYTVPSTVTRIEDQAFRSCPGLTRVTIPDSVLTIGNQSFEQCGGLTQVLVGDGATQIGRNAFSLCRNLAAITLGEGVRVIEDSAFFNCPGLTEIRLPDKVARLGSGALAGCTGLTRLTIGRGLTEIGSFALGECTSLTEITTDALNPSFRSVDGVLFDKTQTTLVRYPAGRAGRYTIPHGVLRIGDEAFSYAYALTQVTLPDTLTSMGEQAFDECYQLGRLTLPAGLTQIGAEAFDNCHGLTTVHFLGDAPEVAESASGLGIFDEAPATVFYRPGTQGWKPTFGGRPTVLWDVQILTGDARWGVHGNHFGFNLTGTSGLAAVIEASSNLSSGDWSPVSTNRLTAGAAQFLDPHEALDSARVYRLVPP